MNFQLTKTQQMTRQAMREFVRKEVAPLARELDENAEFPMANFKQALDLEVLEITLPETLGGIGDDFLCFIIALEEFAWGNAALAHSISVTEAVIHLLCRYGSRNQQEKFIPSLLAGKSFGTIAPWLPDDYNAGANTVQVARNGQAYRLDGSLVFVPNGAMADEIIVFAASGDGNISAFIVEKASQGFKVTDSGPLMGMRSLPMGRVEMNNVPLEKDYLLGREGEGRLIYDLFSVRIQTAIAAISLGISQAALEEALKHSKQRVQFGKPLAQMTATRNKIADMVTGIAATRMLVYQAAFHQENMREAVQGAAMANLMASELAVETTREAVQIHGGYGYVKDYAVERLYRDALFPRVFNNSNEIRRDTIADYAYRKTK